MNIDNLIKATKKLKILLLDSSLTTKKIRYKVLDKLFEHIDVEKDGHIAISKYNAFYNKNTYFYDIVFLNLESSSMDVKELSKLMIDLNPLQEIVVLYTSKDFERLVELLNFGVKKFIQMPLKEEEVHKVVTETIKNIDKKKLKEADNEELFHHLQRHAEKNNELEEFRHALDISAIVAKTNPQGQITYVNKQFCDVCGYSQEELIGKNNRMLKSPRKSSSSYKELWDTIGTKKSYKHTFENLHKNGSFYYVETTINPILDIHGEIVEFIAVSHDKTLLMNSLEATRLAKKSKEDFFVNISHEMKTPLNSIIGFASLLKKRVSHDDKSLMMLNTILETGNDLNYLVHSIIDMRQIQEQTLVIKDLPFNPRLELNKTLLKYKEKALEKSLDYKVVMDFSMPESLLGDIVRINQVMSIVIDNAVKFTSSGGTIDINIVYDIFSDTLHCDVKDSGIGIAKENQKKIFDLEQLDSSVNRSYEGMGIGLNIASNIIKIMKGKIKLRSILTKGSLFSLEFPLSNKSL